jgi:hypothetical protein
MLLYLMAKERFGDGWLSWITLGYLILILVGSVHLAWHYLVDGIIAIVLTYPIWRLSDVIVTWLTIDPLVNKTP